MSNRYEVCPAASLKPGDRVIVTVKDRSIGVFNVNGEYFAIQNTCPHMGAPLCRGRQTGTGTYDEVGRPRRERLGEVIRCPWHGWEFEIATGESTFNPHQYRARTYETAVESPIEATPGDASVTVTEGSDEELTEAEREQISREPGFIGQPPIDTFETVVEDDVVVLYV